MTWNESFCQYELSTKIITVFKDATVFVEKEGVCESNERSIEIELPYQSKPNKQNNYGYNSPNNYVENNIILGTIEVEAPGNKILTKQSTRILKNNIPLSSISQIFQKNVGKEIEIILKESDKKIKGIIFSLENTGQNSFTSQNVNTKTIILKQQDNWKLVNLSEIDHFQFIDQPDLFSESTEQKLLINLEKDKQDQLVKLSYLRKGITWTPSYFISIGSKDKLKISLNANVLNDVENLSNVDLNLAVGIPVFKYSAIAAPLVSDDRVIDLINKINNPIDGSNGRRNNINSQSQISFHNIAIKEVYGNNEYPSAEGEDDDDIFLYHLNGVSMKIGDRLNFNITEFETTFKDVYTVDLQPNDHFISNNKKEDNPTNIWHAIKFKNDADVPLTTGSVFFKKYKSLTNSIIPISQEKLNYTPVGETCIVKMAVSPNIIIKQSEKEIFRQKDTIYHSGYYGYLVKVKGEIELINLKNEKLDMIVNRNIKAVNLIESSEEWKTMQTYRRIFARNQTNIVQWNFAIEANGKKTIHYEYEIHVRD